MSSRDAALTHQPVQPSTCTADDLSWLVAADCKSADGSTNPRAITKRETLEKVPFVCGGTGTSSGKSLRRDLATSASPDPIFSYLNMSARAGARCDFHSARRLRSWI